MTTKIPAELSSTPGIADSSNATAVTIDSNEKIIIGDTASHVDDLLQIETPASGGGHGIQIRRNDSNTDQGIGRILFGNNTDTDLATISAKTDGANDSGAITFSTQATGGSSSERLRILSGGGITFNGDTATANALDDYEEGTFTPNLRFGSTDNATTYDRTGQYTKIGNIVYVTVQLGFPNGVTTSDSGIAHITNLPFTSISGARHIGPLSPYGMSGFGNRPVCRIGGGSAILYLNDDHAGNFYVASDFATSAEMFMSITYQGA